MEQWLAELIDGLEHSTPQGREEASGLRELAAEVATLDFERTALRAERDEMLEALGKIRDLSRPGQELDVSGAIDVLCDIWNVARTAIGKAEGR